MAREPVKYSQEKLDRIAVWAARNRGVQSKIATQIKPSVTPQFVHHILLGTRKSKGGVIEKLLRAAGAPI